MSCVWTYSFAQKLRVLCLDLVYDKTECIVWKQDISYCTQGNLYDVLYSLTSNDVIYAFLHSQYVPGTWSDNLPTIVMYLLTRL